MKIKLSLIISLYNFWIGIMFDKKNKQLLIFLLPIFGIKVKFEDKMIINEFEGSYNNSITESNSIKRYRETVTLWDGHS